MGGWRRLALFPGRNADFGTGGAVWKYTLVGCTHGLMSCTDAFSVSAAGFIAGKQEGILYDAVSGGGFSDSIRKKQKLK